MFARQAAEALGRIGPAAREAIPALKRASAGGEFPPDLSAREALRKIVPDGDYD